MAHKLKKCPFCGGKGVLNKSGSFVVVYRVECSECFCAIDCDFGNKEEAVLKWNNRREV